MISRSGWRRQALVLALPCLALAAACTQILGIEDPLIRQRRDASADAQPVNDARPDMMDASTDVATDVQPDTYPECNLDDPFTMIDLVPGLENLTLYSVRFTQDEKVAYLSGENEAGIDLWFAVRKDGGFSDPRPINGVNLDSSEYWPSVSDDNRVIYFESDRPLDGGPGSDTARIWTATRANTSVDFGTPEIQPLFKIPSGSAVESSPYLHPDAGSIYFSSIARSDAGNFDLFVADRVNGLVTGVVALDALNSPEEENHPMPSFDQTALYFSRPDNFDDRYRNIWVARLDPNSGAFGVPKLVAELQTHLDEFPSWISRDNCRLYFLSDRPDPTPDAGATPVAHRAWVASRTPK